MGEYSFSLNTIQAALQRHLSSNAETLRNVSLDFRALQNDFERVYFAYGILKEYRLFPDVINVEKCDEKSEERRNYGNHVFVKLKKDFTAMKHYNKAIAYAKTNDVLALAYGNRSAVYFQNKLYQNCNQDIDNALKNNYPEHLIKKINERKKRAQDSTPIINKEEYYTPVPPMTGQQNPRIECASDLIEMQNNEIMGRHIIATRDIDPGDVIAIEKPYTNILLYNYYLTHCHNCLEPSFNLIPCLRCPLTLYCSDVCRDVAWKNYHKYECFLLDTLHSIDATKLQLLALRIVLTARGHTSKYQDLSTTDEVVYKSSNYKEIHNLITNEEHRSVSDLFARAFVAATLLYLLEATTFFDDVDNREMFKKNCAVLLLKHLQTAPSNMHESSELQGNLDNGYEIVEIGAGAYSFMSLLNHSCAPNVVRHCHGTTMVLRALRPISAGQQLFDNYGYHHALMDREERRTHLKDQYLFTCECEACVENFPLYSVLSEGHQNFIVTSSELNDLVNAKRDAAIKLIPVLLVNAKEFEAAVPKKFVEILDNQEILKQCFTILGNKNTVF